MTTTRDLRRTPGWGWCGCPRPDRAHEPECLLDLGHRRRPGTQHSVEARLATMQRQLDQLLGLLAPRPGACVFCHRPLDREAIAQHDDRCTRCARGPVARVAGGRP